MKHVNILTKKRLRAALVIMALVIPKCASGQSTYSTPYTISTFAGSGNYGSQNGTGTNAWFANPFGVTVDTNGNVFVADTDASIIRKITPAGAVSTFAGLAFFTGSTDSTGSGARFYWPYAVALDRAGNLYVADTFNHTIRKITTGALVTTFAGLAGNSGTQDGTGNAARFNQPEGIAVDSAGNVYVADTYNSTIRKITPARVVTTLAGFPGGSGFADGTNSNALFSRPRGLAVDSGGNIYIADSYNNAIRAVTPAGVVKTLAGSPLSGSADGTGSAAQFYFPVAIAADSGGVLYVGDGNNYTLRKVSQAGVVTTLAGFAAASGSVDGTGSAARFYSPMGVAVGTNGILYVADNNNNEIRKGVLGPYVQVSVNPTNVGPVPMTVSFTASNLDSAGNTIVSWNWTFGDGGISTLQNPSHFYQSLGMFLPTLVATNSLGKAVNGGVPTITTVMPTMAADANPTSGAIPLTVQFTSDSTDNGGNAITSWYWDFGDGGTTSTLQNPSYTYRSIGSGTYLPTLMATNSYGSNVGAYIPPIFVSLPTAEYTASPTQGVASLSVQFNGPGVDSVGSVITNWSWSFGDGATSQAQNPSHTYTNGGLFYPFVFASDNNGNTIDATGPQIHVATYSGLVLNGGFETGDFFGWVLNGQGAGYNIVEPWSPEISGPHSGSYFLRLGQTGSLGFLSQTNATTPGANYLLSFWLNSPDGQTPNIFQVLWNGALVYAGTNLPAFGWRNFQFTVTATNSASVLQFAFEDDPTALGLDDISLVQIGPGITQQPQSQTVPCRSNATFMVTANGPQPLSYQWLLNNAPIAGATNSSYTLTATCQNLAGYSVVVTNSGGAITSSVATLTIVDTNPPAIFCPANLVFSTAPGRCSAIATYSVTATDDCGIVSLTLSPPSGSVFPKGTNLVTAAARDCAGNSNSCSFAVVVVDQEPPVLSSATNQTLVCNSSNGAQAFFAPRATDNCDGTVPVVSTPPSGSYFALGTNTVSCLATDLSGNSNTCSFTITVLEALPLLNLVQSGANVVLSWRQSCSTYSIEHRSSLDPGAQWRRLGLSPTLNHGVFSITNLLTSSNDFFRLAKSP